MIEEIYRDDELVLSVQLSVCVFVRPLALPNYAFLYLPPSPGYKAVIYNIFPILNTLF